MEFKLREIHDLMPYGNLLGSDAEYMSEIAAMKTTKLQSTPQYELVVDTTYLFTPKLRYFAMLISNGVNNHLNKSMAAIEQDGTDAMAMYMLKKTREAVTTLIKDANREISLIDMGGGTWANLSSESPNLYIMKEVNEVLIFYHYVIAELVRCWLELQGKYISLIGNGAYDVNLIYSTTIDKSPDKMFAVSLVSTEQESADSGIGDIPENEERHKKLQELNKVVREHIVYKMKTYNVNYYKLSLFIEEYFVQKCEHAYEWIAVYLFLRDNSLLCNKEIKTFAKQMQSWFAGMDNLPPNDYRHFTLLFSYEMNEWNLIPKNKNLTDAVIGNIQKRYNHMIDNFNMPDICFKDMMQ